MVTSILRQKIKSPVSRELIWCAEYSDGTYLTEFDLDTKKPNSLSAIKVNETIRFGLLGADMPIYFEVFGGNFNIAGRGISLMYETEDNVYPLIGKPQMYNNFIAYKNGVAELDLSGGKAKQLIGWGRPQGDVVEYVIGYRAFIEHKGVKFRLKATVTVPFQKPIYMTFTLGADKELNGHLVIYRNSEKFETIEAPIDPELGGEVSWEVK